MPLPSKGPIVQVQEEGLSTQECTLKRAPWLLSGMILMGLDSYFPPTIFHILFMDTPLGDHDSSALDGVLVDSSSRMGAKSSYFSPPLSHLCSLKCKQKS
ncbi:hypothetical protein DSO57_1011499 [Entomophthora muscae]|uniref:Uncharacterized protein n=1 Tax=Entomophthora muscae TaxID=34485 RepID=A0ACC2TTB9_9FUNG|nr:hypothetical protein DSO57_1011499 [Entomophthora muscae]